METSRRHLGLHQEVLLLALRDDEGTPESRAGLTGFALGGAILSELVLAGCVAIAPGKRPLVDLVAPRPFGDEVLDECLGLIAAARRRRRAAHWVSRFAHLRQLRHRVAVGLCHRGILEDSEARLLLVFRRQAYPTIDPQPEAALVERMRRAIESDDELDPRTAVLLALAHATGLLRVHFDRATRKRRRQRLERIAKAEVVGGATREAVQTAQAAVIAATTAATVAATAASS